MKILTLLEFNHLTLNPASLPEYLIRAIVESVMSYFPRRRMPLATRD
jgi:hypothetical protein